MTAVVTTKYDGGIASAEAKGVAGRDFNIVMSSNVRHVVEIAVRIGVLVIDGGRQQVVLYRQAAGGHFGGPARPLHMTDGRLNRTDRNIVSTLAENFLHDDS